MDYRLVARRRDLVPRDEYPVFDPKLFIRNDLTILKQFTEVLLREIMSDLYAIHPSFGQTEFNSFQGAFAFYIM